MPRAPIHPGNHLAEELSKHNMSAAELARQFAVTVNRITQFLNAQQSATADTALCLGDGFRTSSEIGRNHQQLYERRRARQALVLRIDKPSHGSGANAPALRHSLAETLRPSNIPKTNKGGHSYFALPPSLWAGMLGIKPLLSAKGQYTASIGRAP